MPGTTARLGTVVWKRLTDRIEPADAGGADDSAMGRSRRISGHGPKELNPCVTFVLSRSSFLLWWFRR